jgi:hypothetical protein
MGTPATKAKQRWNKEHYVQIKVCVKPEVAREFKRSCASEGVSMAGRISALMAANHASPAVPRPDDGFSTRKKRRKKLALAISLLESIREAEDEYMERIPTNLKGSMAAETAASALSALDDAIFSLESVY